MSEFWLISAPGENTPQKTWERLNQATSTGPEKLSTNFKFNIPDLRVGTLDVLVALSDDLGKLDVFTEGVTRKVAQYLGEVLEDSRDKLMENLRIGDATPAAYLHKFTWEGAKYPIKQSLRYLSDMIGKQVSQIEADLKTKANAYNNLKGNLQSLERKATGSLLTRNLADLVKKEDFVLDSEYLVTLLVIVPKNVSNDWFNKYEKLTDMVVPRSSRIVFEDSDSLLVNVTLFQKVVCGREIADGKTEVTRLEADKKKQFGPLVKWLRINFGECFTAWMHVKALRVFVESVLRYGLPVNFQAVVMQPNKRSQKRLREVLLQLYSHLDNAHVSSADAAAMGMDIPGLNLGSADYYPYVYYRINLDLLDSQRL
ncbi:hypothetical protein BaRGS_00031835 [Batillaria attramentaria]|uniref:V-type proton ATPase subunit C n=1 Tax=Batillaria attramentaria TaxID=370345 RepID=A0ABD0JQ94_9CAEN